MARAIRASASRAVIVHSENGFASRKLDEGRMAHPPPGMPSALRVQLWPAQNCSLQKSDTGLTERPYQTTEMSKGCVQRRSSEPALPSLVRLARKRRRDQSLSQRHHPEV